MVRISSGPYNAVLRALWNSVKSLIRPLKRPSKNSWKGLIKLFEKAV